MVLFLISSSSFRFFWVISFTVPDSLVGSSLLPRVITLPVMATQMVESSNDLNESSYSKILLAL
jgi:hypothetical protein